MAENNCTESTRPQLTPEQTQRLTEIGDGPEEYQTVFEIVDRVLREASHAAHDAAPMRLHL